MLFFPSKLGTEGAQKGTSRDILEAADSPSLLFTQKYQDRPCCADGLMHLVSHPLSPKVCQRLSSLDTKSSDCRSLDQCSCSSSQWSPMPLGCWYVWSLAQCLLWRNSRQGSVGTALVEVGIPDHVAGPSAHMSGAVRRVGIHIQWLLRWEEGEKPAFPLQVTFRHISIR